MPTISLGKVINSMIRGEREGPVLMGLRTPRFAGQRGWIHKGSE